MSCVLRVSGTDFNVDEYLSRAGWEGVKVYYQGDRRGVTGRLGTNDHSGFNLIVSNAEFTDFEGQQQGVIQFIRKYSANLKLLAEYPINGWKHFDFGLSTYPPNQFSKTYVLSNELLKLVSDVGLEIMMSNYFTRNEDYLRRRARKHKKHWPIKK